ncbi:MAG TPA: ABC transporter permease [Polyangia bacterium]
MRAGPTIRLAGRALWRNKTRSFLTALGIIIGVAAVIAMVAIGQGAKVRVAETFESMGTNLLIVLPGSSAAGGLQGGFGSQATVTWDDFEAIATELSAVRSAAPMLRAAAVVQSEEQNWTTGVVGTTPDYLAIRSWAVADGRSFDPSETESAAKVVLLGATVAERLFGAGASPVGHSVRIKRIPFQVIGVLARKGQSPMGQDNDDVVLMPAGTFSSKIQGGLGKYLAGAVFVSATAPDTTALAQAQITALLRDRHRLPPGIDDDFSVRNLAEMASAQEAGMKVLSTLLASIAAVALLVGGIGIMNIMLVSVTERTREIGLRVAVGARPRDVLRQFLVEALTLSLAGGAVGVAVGLGAGMFLAARFHWPIVIQPAVIVTAAGFSALVGLGFGLYPARKAARLDPIEALRYE